MALTDYELVAAMGDRSRTTTEDREPFGPFTVEHFPCGCEASKWDQVDGGWTVSTASECPEGHRDMARRGLLAGTARNDDELGKKLERKRNQKRRH
jgi:hypothetical protein